jgi:hypothetical protein
MFSRLVLLMAFTIQASVGSSQTAATGRPGQGHIVYATGQGAWWAFYLSSTQSLSALYSTNLGTSWTAPTNSPFSLVQVHNSEGRNFGFGYANISSTDVLHVAANYYFGASLKRHYHSRFTLGTTWTNTNAESQLTTVTDGTTWTGTPAVALDSNKRPIDSGTYLIDGVGGVIRATNTDAGSSWTAGYGTATNFYNSGFYTRASAILSISSGNAIAICSLDGSGADAITNLKSSYWGGSSWASAVSVFGSAITATSDDNWGACVLSTGTVVCVALSNNNNTFTAASTTSGTWSSMTAPGNLTLGAQSGLSFIADASGNGWLFACDSSKNIQYNEWNGSSWGGWTVLEATRTNTPSYITGAYDGSAHIMAAWTEANGGNNDIIGSSLATSSSAPFFRRPWFFRTGSRNVG